MEPFAHLLPTEEHHSKERCLHKEGKDSLNGQRGAKDIPHKPGVIAPVGTELKLKDNSRCYTYSKIYSKKFHPEFCCLLPEFITFHYIKGFHYSHNKGKPQRKGYKQPMITGRYCKLQSRPKYCIHNHCSLI